MHCFVKEVQRIKSCVSVGWWEKIQSDGLYSRSDEIQGNLWICYTPKILKVMALDSARIFLEFKIKRPYSHMALILKPR